MDPLNQTQQNINPHPSAVPLTPSSLPPTPPPPPPVQPSPPSSPQPSRITPNIPAGGLTPPPPKPEVAMHTMAGDIASIEKSGGAPPQPEYITVNPVTAAPETAAPAPLELPSGETGRGRTMLLWLAALIIIVGFGSLLYTYGLPYYRSLQETATITPVEDLVAPAPAPEPTPPPPPPQPTTTPFGTPTETLAAVPLPDTTLISALAALQTASTEIPTSPPFKEFKVLDAQGAPLSFSSYLAILLPEAQNLGLVETFNAAFELNFGAYFFYDDKGAWPGYIVKLNPASGIDIITLTDRLQKIELSPVGNFFLAQPGAPQPFKTGQALGKYTDRYALFSQPGALFSYGLFGEYFIINTSNEGLKQVLQKLAL